MFLLGPVALMFRCLVSGRSAGCYVMFTVQLVYSSQLHTGNLSSTVLGHLVKCSAMFSFGRNVCLHKLHLNSILSSSSNSNFATCSLLFLHRVQM